MLVVEVLMEFTRCSARGGWGWWIAVCAVLFTTAYIPQGNRLKLLLFVTCSLGEPSNVHVQYLLIASHNTDYTPVSSCHTYIMYAHNVYRKCTG